MTCQGGETPDQHIELAAHKFGRVMDIGDWREGDGVIIMDVTEGRFVGWE
jgi:hypothetical protein